MTAAADSALEFSLDLARFDATERRRITSLLNNLQKELTASLATTTPIGKARAKRLIADAKATIERYYDQAQADLFDTLDAVSEVSATAASATLSAVLPATLEVSLPTAAVMRALIGDALIMGAPQKAWWAKQKADVAFRFAAVVRQGLVSAQTNQQIIRRVAEELEVTRRNAAALVQTSVATVANDARMATFEANADVITGLRWMATLDAHTCPRCAALDGMTWKMDGSPIHASLPFTRPPLHWNDRCTLVPQTRFSTMGSGQRASVDGPVDRTTTFADFLDRKGKAFQDDVLGPGRADLWREGKITLADLTSGTGRPLTLAQLRARHG